MLLAVDVGNTHIVLGVFEGTKLSHHFRLSTQPYRTVDEYGVILRELLHEEGIEMSGIRGAVLASVAPEVTHLMAELCERKLGIEPVIVGPGIRTGMPIRYDSPRDVGADRIVNGIAAHERLATDGHADHGAIVVDFGTATTFDVISPAGEYCGGAIAPGIAISTQALFEHAAKLPRIELVRPDTAIGQSTVTSMQAGIVYGYASLVDGMVTRIRDELDFPVRVFATGGLAQLIADATDSIKNVDELLTLRGLRLVYERNAQRAS